MKSVETEPGDIVPTQISPEAWNAAMVIDEEIAKLLHEIGLRRREGHSLLTVSIAKMVQLAINQSHERQKNELLAS